MQIGILPFMHTISWRHADLYLQQLSSSSSPDFYLQFSPPHSICVTFISVSSSLQAVSWNTHYTHHSLLFNLSLQISVFSPGLGLFIRPSALSSPPSHMPPPCCRAHYADRLLSLSTGVPITVCLSVLCFFVTPFSYIVIFH